MQIICQKFGQILILLLMLYLAACLPPKKSIVVDHNIISKNNNPDINKNFPGFANLESTEGINKYQPLAGKTSSSFGTEDRMFNIGFSSNENIHSSDSERKAVFSTKTYDDKFTISSNIQHCEGNILLMFHDCGTIRMDIKSRREELDDPSSIYIKRKYKNITTHFSALYYTTKIAQATHAKKDLDDLMSAVSNKYIFLNNRSLSDIDLIMTNLSQDYNMKYSGFGSMIIKNTIKYRDDSYNLKFHQYNLPIQLEVELNRESKIPKVSGSFNFSQRPNLDIDDFTISFSGLTRIQSEEAKSNNNLLKEYYQINNINIEYSSNNSSAPSERIYNSGKLNFFGLDTLEEIAGVIRVSLRGSIARDSYPHSLAIVSFISLKPVN